jgi:hypothetical protein
MLIDRRATSIKHLAYPAAATWGEKNAYQKMVQYVSPMSTGPHTRVIPVPIVAAWHGDAQDIELNPRRLLLDTRTTLRYLLPAVLAANVYRAKSAPTSTGAALRTSVRMER